jgi:DNA-binding GntR family transcriptional regulator
VIIAMVRNIMDRTHYVRFIDLEVPARFNHALDSISEMAASLQDGDVARAIDTLERDFRLVIARMSGLIREGVSRAYVLHAPPASMAVSAMATRSRV